MKVGRVIDGETLCLCISLFENYFVDVDFEAFGREGEAALLFSMNDDIFC